MIALDYRFRAFARGMADARPFSFGQPFYVGSVPLDGCAPRFGPCFLVVALLDFHTAEKLCLRDFQRNGLISSPWNRVSAMNWIHWDQYRRCLLSLFVQYPLLYSPTFA